MPDSDGYEIPDGDPEQCPDHLKEAPIPPKNFRTLTVKINGGDVELAGMSNPKNVYGKPYEGNVMRHLKEEQGISVLVDLHNEHDGSVAAEQEGLTQHIIRIPDFAKEPISPEIFDDVYRKVVEATNEGKKVGIYCGAGNGRTGTVLAAITMRARCEGNPALLEMEGDPVMSVSTNHDKKTTPCTPLVHGAIEHVRESCIPKDEEGSSVESENDVQSLSQYAKHIQKNLPSMIRETKTLASFSGDEQAPKEGAPGKDETSKKGPEVDSDPHTSHY